jgi:hypothetical protein
LIGALVRRAHFGRIGEVDLLPRGDVSGRTPWRAGSRPANPVLDGALRPMAVPHDAIATVGHFHFQLIGFRSQQLGQHSAPSRQWIIDCFRLTEIWSDSENTAAIAGGRIPAVL